MNPEQQPPATPVHVSLKRDEYPFTLQAHDEASGDLLWHLRVLGPGEIHVPGFAPLRVRITHICHDGRAYIKNSDGTETQTTIDLSAASAVATQTLNDAPAAQHQEVLDRIRADAGQLDEQ